MSVDNDRFEPKSVRQEAKRGWWSRNWLWFVPTMLLAVILLGGGAIYWALFARVHGLAVYQTAMQTIAADRELQQKLGQPIEAVSWPPRSAAPSARIEDREIDVRWAVQGPKARGEAHLQAKLLAGQWELVILEVDGKRVALPDEGGAAPFDASKSQAKEPESKGPAPEINLPIPPGDGPGKP
jgi:hypothetical protein